MNNHIQILSMNVRGLFSNTKKRSDVFNWVKAKKISIVCFQETHSRVLEIFLVVSDIRTDNLQDFVSPNKLLSVRTFLNKTLYMY